MMVGVCRLVKVKTHIPPEPFSKEELRDKKFKLKDVDVDCLLEHIDFIFTLMGDEELGKEWVRRVQVVLEEGVI